MNVVNELVDYARHAAPGNVEKVDEWTIEVNDNRISAWLDELHKDDLGVLLQCYNDSIRSEFLLGLAIREEGIIVLLYYEALLAAFLQTYYDSKDTHNVVEGEAMQTANNVLRTVQEDIMVLTKESYNDAATTTTHVEPVIATLISLTGNLATLSSSSHAAVFSLLLAFSCPQQELGPLHLVPGLKDLDLLHQSSIPMTTKSPLPSHVLRDWMDWESIVIKADVWLTEKTTRAAARSAEQLSQHLNPSVTDETLYYSTICKAVGWEAVAKAIRAQFFGRSLSTQLVQKAPSRPPPLNYPLKLQQQQSRSTRTNLMSQRGRVYAVIQFTKLLDANILTKPLADELMPVYFSMVDSTDISLVALGAACIIRVLDIVAKDKLELLLHDIQDGLLSILERAVKTCSNGVALAVVCRTCTKLFPILPDASKYRRKFTAHFLQAIQYKCHLQADEEGYLRGVIGYGLIPLFLQQARLPNAEAMEAVPATLGVLLPLCRWDNDGPSGRIVQLLALVALINLMEAGYPVMPFHGGKIMCELLACWGHAMRSIGEAASEMNTYCKDLSKHAASVALLFCGNSGKAILEEVKNANASSEFEPSMVEFAQEVSRVGV